MTNDDEKLLNEIVLLKQGLEFYANEENYDVNRPVDDKLYSPVELDKGSQARFALKRVDDVLNEYQKMIDEYMDTVKNQVEQNSSEGMLKLIEEIKKVGNDNKHI